MMRTTRWRIGAVIAAHVVAVSVSSGSSATVALDDASSRIFLLCNSAQAASGDFPEAVDFSCEGHPTSQTTEGTTRASLSSSFESLLFTSVSTECVGCPFAASTISSSRISFELAVVQQAAPPHPVATVPVRITTEGAVGVSRLGLLAGGGSYLSSTLQTIFTQADVFAHTMRTLPMSGPVLSDDYAITDTIDLLPDQAYFGNVFVGCNQNSSVPGDWACSGHASVSFALDQEAFDARQGANTFDLAQYVSIQRSANLVPEPTAIGLGGAAFAVLALSMRVRTVSRRSRARRSRGRRASR